MFTPAEARSMVRKAVKRVPEGEEIRHLNIMPMMDMMTKMMPSGFFMMMGKMPKEQRLEHAKEMIATIAGKACEGLTKEERDAFFDDVVTEVRSTAEGK